MLLYVQNMLTVVNRPQLIRVQPVPLYSNTIPFKTTNVPGKPQDRLKRITHDFTKSKLSRLFDANSDFFHWPADYDTTTGKRIWMNLNGVDLALSFPLVLRRLSY